MGKHCSADHFSVEQQTDKQKKMGHTTILLTYLYNDTVIMKTSIADVDLNELIHINVQAY